MPILGNVLGPIMRVCYNLTNNYGTAIILFTLFTKICLFPLNIWLHKNGIKIIKMQATLNNIKAEYYGDSSMIAEKQSEIYKQEHYNPLYNLIPLICQILILMGLVEVIYHPLTYILGLSQDVVKPLIDSTATVLGINADVGTIQLSVVNAIKSGSLSMEMAQSSKQILSAITQIADFQNYFLGINVCIIPSIEKSWFIIAPISAAFSSWLLCVYQNAQNVLQKEQGLWNKYGTMILSVLLSLYLGWFVPVGVALYWIVSNLFAIMLTIVLNIAINPKKYVDYEALEDSRRKLKEIEDLQPDRHSEEAKANAKREKEDYKKFFSIANKHLVFYSEKSGFYKYFSGMIDYLLNNSNIIIHYVTSDPQDQIFRIAETKSRIHPYYIGEKRLITLMMKMDADIVIMTMPDIDNYHIKRSYVKKDIEYIYVFHGIFTSLRTLRPGALDHYDTLFTLGDYQEQEIRQYENQFNTTKKRLVPCGYGLIEQMAMDFEHYSIEEHEIKPHILIAPSHQPDNILESCLNSLVETLLNAGYDVTVRPHPQYLKRFPQEFHKIMESCNGYPEDHFRFELDFSSNQSVYSCDLLITDWSGIGFEYSLSTLHPVMYINTPMKVINPQLEVKSGDNEPFDLQMRNKMGKALFPEDIQDKAGEIVKDLIVNREHYIETIREIRNTHVYHFGKSSEYSGKYILTELMNKQKA